MTFHKIPKVWDNKILTTPPIYKIYKIRKKVLRQKLTVKEEFSKFKWNH